MTLNQNQAQFAKDVSVLLAFIFDEGYTCTLGEAFRTHDQAEIYAKEGLGIVNSQHCKRLAIDLMLFKNGVYLSDPKEYERFGCYWENLDPHNRWGGRFKRVDADHFERQEA